MHFCLNSWDLLTQDAAYPEGKRERIRHTRRVVVAKQDVLTSAISVTDAFPIIVDILHEGQAKVHWPF